MLGYRDPAIWFGSLQDKASGLPIREGRESYLWVAGWVCGGAGRF